MCHVGHPVQIEKKSWGNFPTGSNYEEVPFTFDDLSKLLLSILWTWFFFSPHLNSIGFTLIYSSYLMNRTARFLNSRFNGNDTQSWAIHSESCWKNRNKPRSWAIFTDRIWIAIKDSAYLLHAKDRHCLYKLFGPFNASYGTWWIWKTCTQSTKRLSRGPRKCF